MKWQTIVIIQTAASIGAIAPSHGQSLIVDHTSVQKFDSIPARWLDSVKTMIIQYVGQSHGRQVPKGLELLEAQNASYGVQIGTNPNQLTEPNALRVILSYGTGSSWSTVNSIGDERYWSIESGRQRTETTAQQAINENRPFRISLWCWCWDICSPDYCHDETGTLVTFNDERMRAYSDAIKRFNEKFPVTKFIYHTSITDTRVNENGWRVTSYNDSIRASAAKENGILFDQAAMENWNAATTQRRSDVWNGHTLYLRHADYDEDVGVAFHDGHTNEALCIRKAKGVWYLLARLAGWDGGAGTKVSMPAISPSSGTYLDSVRASITCATQGVTVRYTTDGTNPSEASSAYTAPLTITKTTTVKAIAFASAMNPSDMASATYTVTPATATGASGHDMAAMHLTRGSEVIEIVYPNGRRIYTASTQTIDTYQSARRNGLPNGIYFIRVSDRAKPDRYRKMVVLR